MFCVKVVQQFVAQQTGKAVSAYEHNVICRHKDAEQAHEQLADLKRQYLTQGVYPYYYSFSCQGSSSTGMLHLHSRDFHAGMTRAGM